jgi:hypothetical protein
LAAARNPHIATAQGVLEFAHHRELVVAAIDVAVGEHEPFPARADEPNRCVGGKLAGIGPVHLAQDVDGREQLARDGRASELERFQKRRGVPPHEAEVIDKQGEGVELFITRESLGITNARREALPRQNSLDGGEGVAAGFFGADERRTDLGVQPDFLVERLAVVGEAALVTVLVLGEERPDEPAVQVENLIGDRGSRIEQNGDHRCVAPLRFVFLDLVHRGLSTLTGDS